MWTFVIQTFRQVKHYEGNRVKSLFFYCTDCWLETGGETLYVPFYPPVQEVIFHFPFVLFVPVSRGKKAAVLTECIQFKRQGVFFFCLGLHALPPPPSTCFNDASHQPEKSTPSLARWLSSSQKTKGRLVATETWGYCQKRDKLSRKKKIRVQISAFLASLCLLFVFTYSYSLHTIKKLFIYILT